MNLTQGCDTVLYWPDTVLSLFYVDVPELHLERDFFQVFPNFPNPVSDHTNILLYVPEMDKVNLTITDILGRVIRKSERLLDKGIHSFRFRPAGVNLFFFTARWRGSMSSIKILKTYTIPTGVSSLEYIENKSSYSKLIIADHIQSFYFNVGDELLYTGYKNSKQSGILDIPETCEIYTFQFATNIPCPNTPTVEYEGQVYYTIQIFNQCWLRENLNIGTMIPVNQWMLNNGIKEKYCYNNEPDSCIKYGGLYLWPEIMQYNYQPGAQGLCPPNWHIPTDEEWKLLEGMVDSYYRIGDLEWNNTWFRGFDAGSNLKSTAGWSYNGNGSDLYGWSGIPGGFRYDTGELAGIGLDNYCWSSSAYDSSHSWFRGLSYYY
jgi:uncharacterized protein (TIGR02145 family)